MCICIFLNTRGVATSTQDAPNGKQAFCFIRSEPKGTLNALWQQIECYCVYVCVRVLLSALLRCCSRTAQFDRPLLFSLVPRRVLGEAEGTADFSRGNDRFLVIAFRTALERLTAILTAAVAFRFKTLNTIHLKSEASLWNHDGRGKNFNWTQTYVNFINIQETPDLGKRATHLKNLAGPMALCYSSVHETEPRFSFIKHQYIWQTLEEEEKNHC